MGKRVVIASQPLRSVWGLAIVLGLLLTGALLIDTPVVVAERARIEATTLAATPRIAGRIARLAVDEGVRVTPGQMLATLDSGELADEVMRAQAALAAAEAGLPASRTAADLQDAQRSAAIDQARAVITGAKADLTAARARAAQADSTLAALRAGQQRGVVGEQEVVTSQADARAAHALVDASQGRLRAAEAALALAHRQAGLGTVERTGLARSAADIRQARAMLAIARRRLDQTNITAPVAGIVARRLAAVGDQVQPGQPVVTVLADAAAWVRAEVREVDVPAIRAGAPATITVDALPDRRWTGRVTRLGVVTEPVDSLVGRSAPTVALTISLDRPGHAGLIPGMTARVSIDRTHGAWWRQAFLPPGPARDGGR
jgi:membrane fusion protein (multidrug efflux system)